MIHDRLQQIATYIDKHNITSYNEIANQLGMKDRQVRYDIDRMNVTLLDQHNPIIKKESKGVLHYQGITALHSFFDYEVEIYTALQRVDFIMLIALFDCEHLNLNRLSDDFKVSRSSIKKDIHLVSERFQRYGLELTYKKGFMLQGNNEHKIACMVDEFTKYIYMYGRRRSHFNTYETYAMHILSRGFLLRDIKAIITWVKEMLEDAKIVMSDHNFRWYIASVTVYVWSILHQREMTVSVNKEMDINIHANWETLEQILQTSLSKPQQKQILYYLNYTNKGYIPTDKDKEQCYKVVSELISKVSYELCFDFGNDDILFDGLLKDMQPLLQRVQDHIAIEEVEIPFMNMEEVTILNTLKHCAHEIEELSKIENEREIVAITMHFIAGMRRRDRVENKRILFVCGLGNAMQKLIEETLQSEFQLEIIDTIPSYKLATYEFKEGIDMVVSVMSVEIECPRPIVFIHPFLEDDDYQKMNTAGIRRKSVLPNIFGIYSRLDFLDETDRTQVMNVMQQELGLHSIRFYKRLHSLRDVLRISDIHVFKSEVDTLDLFDIKTALHEFDETSLVSYEMKWHDDIFYLYHNKEHNAAYKTKMFLSLTSDHSIHIALISQEAMEQVPAYQELYDLILHSDFLSRSKQASNAEEIYRNLLYCEQCIANKRK